MLPLVDDCALTVRSWRLNLYIGRVPLIQRYAVESSEMSKNNMQKYMQLISLSSLPQSSGPKYRCLNAINRLS